MKIAINKGFICGHFSERAEFDIETFDQLSLVNIMRPVICDRCNDIMEVKRLNLFVVERQIPDIT